MKHQRNYNERIGDGGCLFVALLEMAEDVAGRRLGDNQVERLYKEAVKAGEMDENCYISWSGHSGIPNRGTALLGRPAKFTYAGARYYPRAIPGRESWGEQGGDEIIMQCKVKDAHSHFIRPAYNPFPELQLIRILSYRVYNFEYI